MKCATGSGSVDEIVNPVAGGSRIGATTGIAGRFGLAAPPARYGLSTTCVRPLWSNTVTMAACAEPANTPRTARTPATASAMRLGIEADDMFDRRVFCTLPCVAGRRPILRNADVIAMTLVTAVLVTGCGASSLNPGCINAANGDVAKMQKCAKLLAAG